MINRQLKVPLLTPCSVFGPGGGRGEKKEVTAVASCFPKFPRGTIKKRSFRAVCQVAKNRSWKCMEFYRALLRLCAYHCFENYFFACSEKGNLKIGHILLNIFFLGQAERTSKFPYFRPSIKRISRSEQFFPRLEGKVVGGVEKVSLDIARL